MPAKRVPVKKVRTKIVKRPIVKRQAWKKETKWDKSKKSVKGFLANFDKFDTLIGFTVGLIFMFWQQLYGTIPTLQLLEYIQPMVSPIIQVSVFFYCVNKAYDILRARKYVVEYEGFKDFAMKNFISITWIVGGLFFIASFSPQILQMLLKLVS